MGIPALCVGLAHLAASRHITFDETLMFERVFDRDPVEISMVTGSLNVPGWNYALGVFVNKDTPISKLTLKQLDGIFGTERDGGYDGTNTLEAQQVIEALNKDRYGIGYSSVAYLTPQTKALAIAAREGNDYVELNLETLRNRTHPLFDEVYLYLDRVPGRPVDPRSEGKGVLALCSEPGRAGHGPTRCQIFAAHRRSGSRAVEEAGVSPVAH